MRREDFEHVIAAAAAVSGEDEIVVVGSQAILGSHPDPPGELLASMEADVYPRRAPEKAEEIDGALGDGSPFHGEFGYYAHGVGPETVTAPAGWEERLVEVRIAPRPGQGKGAIALCLEAHDLVLSKAAAGRERDREYAREALRAEIVEYDELLRRARDLPVNPEAKARVRRMLEGIGRQLDLDLGGGSQPPRS
jgi:hypothetical protein